MPRLSKPKRKSVKRGRRRLSSTASAYPAQRPVKFSKRAARQKKTSKKTDGSGPLEWLLPMLESSYTPLNSSTQPASAVATETASAFTPNSMATIAPAQETIWRDILLEYKRRKATAVAAPPPAVAATPRPPTL